MCFYTRTDYACGDWKWGNMKEQCPREHRIGETCGAKLSHGDSNIRSPQTCKICTEIATKRRRLTKARADLNRYTTERNLPALAQAKDEEIQEIEHAIRKLNEQRVSSKYLRTKNDERHDTSQRYRPLPPISDTFYAPVQRHDATSRHSVYRPGPDSSRLPIRI